jgi:hypothetical protein
MLTGDGVTWTDTRSAEVTVRLAVPDINPEVAVMVTGPPGVTPSTRPGSMTVAIPVSLEVHPTDPVRSWVVASV